MRYTVTFSSLSPVAKVGLHAADCSNATKRPGRNIERLPAGTTYAEALQIIEERAAEVGRKHAVCHCVNAKGPAVLRDVFEAR